MGLGLFWVSGARMQLYGVAEFLIQTKNTYTEYVCLNWILGRYEDLIQENYYYLWEKNALKYMAIPQF